MTTDSRTTKPCDDGNPKKEYRTPTLRVYGDIREITQAAGNNGKHSDSGQVHLFKKTGI
jgi:hypothetical protein